MKSQMEFLIRRTDGEWFDLRKADFAAVLHPQSFPHRCIEGRGDYRIEVAGGEVAFTYEDPGIQVSFEPGDFPEETAEQIVREVLQNIEALTGQKGRIIFLG